jgi:hypothetical protein
MSAERRIRMEQNRKVDSLEKKEDEIHVVKKERRSHQD